MNEDLKKNQSSIINVDFIRMLFTKCELHLLNTFRYVGPEIFIDTNYKKIMALTLSSFNASNYLSQENAQSFMRILSRDTNTPPTFPLFSDIFHPISDSIRPNDFSEGTIRLSQLPIEDILRWFMLIYEVKIVFGGVLYDIV
ncbi:hypothetical protein RF11_08719 [Thelohanellus kitauei]|uniref:Uncharacterized protein n=1 Tax=Thelohanellus kitauei TaxID=669202 RepID=A0A0C2J3R9_THEKT|nr:hypothetical protein RF11_08719 [Thelohanellus kitauei]